MKLLPILLFALVMQCGAQTNELCRERGHVPSQMCTRTLMADYSETVDLPDRTLLIHHDPNYTTCNCQRCGEQFTLPHKECDTAVVWRKPPDVTDSTSGLPGVTLCLSPNGIYHHSEHSWISIATVEGITMQVCMNCLQWRRKP